MNTAFSAKHVEQLAQLLEMEQKGHRTKRSWCLAMFGISFVCLMFALVAVGVSVVRLFDDPDMASGTQLILLQVLAPLAAAAVSLFSTWWAVQNCMHSIDRALFAARSGSPELFAAFLNQIQCADEKKKKLWLELVKSVVT
jgi:hypothetical protein